MDSHSDDATKAGATRSAAAAPQELPEVRVRSVARAWQILRTVAQSEFGLTANEISRTTGLPVQATYHLVHTLLSLRLLARNERRAYILGLGMGEIADAFFRQIAPPPELLEQVRKITMETGETAYACGWVDGEIVVIHVNRGNRPVQVSDVTRGSFDFAHARASGKLLLAFAPPARQRDYLANHHLQPRTAKSITTAAALADELAQVQRLGYAVDEEEFLEGVCCMAIPADPSNLFSLTISAPLERYLARKDYYLETMRAIAQG